MKFDEFKKTCERLETNFERELPADKGALWFEKLRYWSAEKFEKVVEILIETGSRFPSLSEIYEAAKGVSVSSERQDSSPRYTCGICDQTGVVSAKLEGYQPSAFRCHNCFNWQGRLSELIPIWSDEFRAKGYAPCWEDQTEFLTGEDAERLLKMAFPKAQFGTKHDSKTFSLQDWDSV